MSRWKIKAATAALAALLVAATVALPVYARELQPLAAAAPEQVGMSGERLARITTVLKKEIAEGKLPGAVVLVARKGKIVYSDAIGSQDKGANTPMKLDSIFRIYSMTKPLASVAAMMLVEDGVIQLTDPVSKFLPAFKDMQVSVATTGADGKTTYANVPAAKPIIVQDLLRHSAGLAYAEITKNEPVKAAYVEAKFSQPGVHEYDSRGMTPAEQVARIAKAPLIHQPGTMWEYSMAVDILGRVVEAASGKRLAVVLDERLFKPLKMDRWRLHESGPEPDSRVYRKMFKGLVYQAKALPSVALQNARHRNRSLAPPTRGCRRGGLGGRIHVGRLRRHLFLGRSEGRAREPSKVE